MNTLKYDEKREYARTTVDCEMTYKRVDSGHIKSGHCTSLSGAGVAFIADCSYAAGLAMEIKVFARAIAATPICAFIEVLRSVPQKERTFLIAATIKILK